MGVLLQRACHTSQAWVQLSKVSTLPSLPQARLKGRNLSVGYTHGVEGILLIQCTYFSCQATS